MSTQYRRPSFADVREKVEALSSVGEKINYLKRVLTTDIQEHMLPPHEEYGREAVRYTPFEVILGGDVESEIAYQKETEAFRGKLELEIEYWENLLPKPDAKLEAGTSEEVKDDGKTDVEPIRWQGTNSQFAAWIRESHLYFMDQITRKKVIEQLALLFVDRTGKPFKVTTIESHAGKHIRDEKTDQIIEESKAEF